ncbi:D-amino acid aminotransferase [Marinobacterium sediminicola]|uniref:D-alanine transaminase n=1 Tax=Marinobacterium sediminicola TaxID=518898 RepID=A0ABY1S0Q2_9GAMM|nr:D-amino acid aminotransferase [Marinobacterium sediminicola]ULG69630.1 D-amino acid aminotransferase [Marinobacterium sediminicola]SMR74642.1 D-alanine transaminase [Marinobacterium sediminicola]
MKSEVVYLNGRFVAPDQAQVSVFDRGFLFADSVYEVIPYYRGVGFRLQQHLDRLAYSLRAVRIQADEDWAAILDELVRRNGGGNLSVYLQVSRGSAGYRTHTYDDSMRPTVFACTSPIRDIYSDGAEQIQGYNVIVTADLRWRRCDIKSTGLLPNILVLQQAREAGADEALLVRDGLLSEGTSSNLFVVKQGVIYTPKRSSEILGGTTRELILELASEAGIPYQEVDIRPEELATADEVWISSSTRGVMPVLTIDGEPVADGQKGPLWHRMFDLFTRFQHRLMTGEA